ncbi:hypothetical protein KL949_002688 [Ogataea haglerorum]|nr:hypothetical protein KL913_002454 [Ogataea haglerorum]KAG7718692.1 hypothetical protein KL949_002688 [Ogataea haglerorum]KAG7743265.1 hypothetical protein KL932_002006 [Ogataea haglerorum]KAG7766999.1 hypothetical protein KL931_003883 [Ogataea haglerorum]
MTIIWCGVQGITTGNCIYVMLYALTPKMAQIHNPFSSDYSITGGRLVGFAIGWVVTLLLAFVPIKNYNKVVVWKTSLMLVLLLIFLIWCLVEAHGVGSIMTKKTHVAAGNSHAWVFLGQMFTQAGQSVTFAANNSDLTRNAAKRNDALYTQMIAAPMASIIVSSKRS